MKKKPVYSDEALTQTLREVLGREDAEFKEVQRDIVRAILDGRDLLAILPTGVGKSVCFQVPAMLLPGVTLVISPLIALIQEQAERLHERGLPVACLSSEFILDENGPYLLHRTMADEEEAPEPVYLRNGIFLGATRGKYKLIYLTPERLRTGAFIRFAQHAKISLIAVDEAHCISLWGYDFRPRYLEISRLLKRIGYHPVVAAFTATAPRSVRKDIIEYLNLKSPAMFGGSHKRNNLSFEVWNTQCKNTSEQKSMFPASFRLRLRKVAAYLRKHRNESGLLYCSAVSYVNEIYKKLSEWGFSVTRYYADLDKDRENRNSGESKKQNMADFVSGDKKIMVSTSALGMGIDKSDIRFVIHFNLPTCLEDYYQQAGRAGRDGKPARCILCYAGEDDLEICQALNEESASESELPEEARIIRQRNAAWRLEKMYGYGKLSACSSTELESYILDYFDSFEAENTSGLEVEKETEVHEIIRRMIRRIDVLYVNRTKIAQELRKGRRQGTDLTVGNTKFKVVHTVSYSIEGPEELSYFDLMVADAVYTLMKHRVPTIYARNIMELLSGVDGLMLSSDRKEDVEKSIRRLMQTQITIDRSKSRGYGFVYDDEQGLTVLQGAFLPLEEKRSGFSYDPQRLPPLYHYAEILNGQFFSFPTRELRKVFGRTEKKYGKNIVLPSSEENLDIVHYLLFRIASMNHLLYNKTWFQHASTARVIRLNTMVEVLRIDLPEETYYRRRKLDTLWIKMLDALAALMPEKPYYLERNLDPRLKKLLNMMAALKPEKPYTADDHDEENKRITFDFLPQFWSVRSDASAASTILRFKQDYFP